jgi:hypothetical protein
MGARGASEWVVRRPIPMRTQSDTERCTDHRLAWSLPSASRCAFPPGDAPGSAPSAPVTTGPALRGASRNRLAPRLLSI